MNEIDDERDLGFGPVYLGLDIPQLPLMPIDQHRPRPLPLGVPPPRLFKDLLGHLFGLRSTLAHTRLWRARTWGASSF